MQQQTTYMGLLDEGVDVWRPVQAIEQATGIFVICEQPIPDGGSRQYGPEPAAGGIQAGAFRDPADSVFGVYHRTAH